MIIENVKKYIIENKVKNNTAFYYNLIKLDKDMTKEEAYEIMSKINPKKTKLIKAKSEKEFLDLLTVDVVEKIFANPVIPQYKAYCRTSLDKIYFIRGKDEAVIGENYNRLNGEVIKKDPEINKKSKYIIVKEKLDNKSFITKVEYEVIVYNS